MATFEPEPRIVVGEALRLLDTTKERLLDNEEALKVLLREVGYAAN